MRRFQVRITTTAKNHIRSIKSWGSENLGQDLDVFASELAHALGQLAELPFSGGSYQAKPGVRRLLLRRSQYHLYYTVDEESRLVMVRAVWHIARGQKPELR